MEAANSLNVMRIPFTGTLVTALITFLLTVTVLALCFCACNYMLHATAKRGNYLS